MENKKRQHCQVHHPRLVVFRCAGILLVPGRSGVKNHLAIVFIRFFRCFEFILSQTKMKKQRVYVVLFGGKNIPMIKIGLFSINISLMIQMRPYFFVGKK